ncbi:DUF58 domain-containing protein [Clostridium sp. JS66]|uniref:DUF58 domain-containing protein n=1 Tax=Clostridium sp. JS66 TaxID=3064705 RepID=UPI00298E5444|nr:DUF58 domain-containing protein [Clostridium sp. JS66]WPC44569.1 DUF58 domain-containing protein [Clostridium sp. JS66]
MSITRRFIYLLSLGIIFLGLGGLINNSLTIFILYNLVCAGLLVADYFMSAEVESIVIERCDEERLSIYEKESICFQVYNKNDYKIYIEIKDEIPDFHFYIENRIISGKIEPYEKKTFKYFIIPQKRGAFEFGNVHIKCEGKLKLCMKIFKINLCKEYKVYPNLKNLRKYKLNICNNRLLKQGQKNLRIIGKGTSFESLREYITGDEYRKINWKATARLNKPIVNTYEPEKNQHVHILIDTGKPMSYTVRGHRKLDMVINAAIVLSDVVNDGGDQSALLLFNTKVNKVVMPGKGVAHRNNILETLYHINSTNEISNYDDAFYYLKKKERHRSIIFIFTDFDTVEEAKNMIKMLPIISRNNIVIMMLIKNESVEKIGSQNVINEEDLFNKGVALELLNERSKIIKLLNRKGIFCIECTGESFEYAVVNKYIQVKNQMYL